MVSPNLRSSLRGAAAALTLSVCLLAPAVGSAASPRVSGLRCDALVDPLGIDDPQPTLSWKIEDGSAGASQTAYRIEVFSSAPNSAEASPDLWDSGRIASSVSNGVTYHGPALAPARRYFWRVQLWGKDGQPYPVSETRWWETGLMDPSAWRAKWIGYESSELHSLRTSGAMWITNPAAAVDQAADPNQDTHHDFRMRFSLGKPVRSVALYTTGEDTADAWVNGSKVLSAHPLPPWKQMPWMTYERQEVTAQAHTGDNLLAIEITRYAVPGSRPSSLTPMSACLSIVYADGTTQLLISDTAHWKSALDGKGAWWSAAYDDSAWASPEVFKSSTNSFGDTNVGRPWPTGPVARVRRSFLVDKKVVSARLYATALGAYKFHLNGQPVGDQILAPGWMDFREHVPYQVYDVTSQIKPGSNVIGAYLAPGWYATPLKWFREGNNYGDTQPALRAQLRLQMADGSVVWIATDEAWKAELSEIRLAEIYDGETRDERLRAPGWDGAHFKDAAWRPVTVVEPKKPRIVAQDYPPIREERVMQAKAITSPSPGVYILDFGQNMAAVPRLRVRGRRDDDIKLRFAEVLNPDGTLYVDNLRTAKATDHFILAGMSGFEELQPEFTFHGFRYMELTGVRQAPTPETIEAVVLHTDAPFTVQFETANKMVNQLWSNVMWGQRSNFVGLPTDCPQRDERLGWTADAQVFWRTAAFNMDLDTFTQKFSGDLRGTQVGTAMYGIFAPGTDQPNPGYGVAWSDAGVIIPWTGWVQSGDRRIIDQNWEAMERYLAAIEQANPEHLWRHNFGATFGDWLTPTITTPEDLLATAYWAYDAAMMQQMAVAVGRSEDAAKYGHLHDAIKSAFAKAYVQSDGTVGSLDRYPSIPPPTIHPKTGDDNKDRFVETQTGYVLALHMDLVPAPLRAAAAKRLVGMIEQNNWLLGTGFLGTPYLLEVLSDTGYSDVAYRLLLNTEYPSWGYLIEHGATTTWERWNGDRMRADPSMNSYNHYAYGAVAEWIYRYAAGIDTDSEDPGFHRIVLHPNFDARLGSLSLDYASVYGAIHSAWQAAGEQISWNVTIPPNTSGIFYPEQTNAGSYLIEGHPLEADPRVYKLSDDAYQFAPGTYTLTGRLISSPLRSQAGAQLVQ
jgi:alpha-L-rhamnosidase